jgi:hypothetical protein
MLIRYFFLLLSLSATITLYGCSLQSNRTIGDIQAGNTFILIKDIEIPANSTRVFIQNGHLTSRNGFDHSDQHCRIEVRDLSESKQTVLAEKFKINSVSIDEEMIAQSKSATVHLAFNTVKTDYLAFIDYLGLNSQERPETMDLIHLNLKSKIQPNVMRLTCAGSLSNGDIAEDPRSYRPDLKSINKILGNIGYIQTRN